MDVQVILCENHVLCVKCKLVYQSSGIKLSFFFLRVCEDFYVKKQVILYALLIVIKQVNTQKRTQLFCIKLFVLVGYADVLERE